ncbi:MAG: preprotein translocase subunit SecE [Eubacteriales bacterium]|nr:preprotein translocase subunit SecE [Eubacteriales bacterium]MDD3073916.1 preprotein translocase subunit SecE [Eubacteriales bacterium]MDD4078316.1 preprotein translocase subunit SecE [Eubacteriales bacterium]MDD4768157.1 preprotein translocase subunit SecE [Eubacteriales bacterium]
MKKLITFLKDVRRELKKVQWPNRRELTTYTAIVLLSVVVVGAIIWVVDLGYQQILTLIFQK